MKLNALGGAFMLGLCLCLTLPSKTQAGFVPFVIRGGSTTSPTINESGGTYEFLITEGGQKAALGSSDIDGYTLGSISKLSITRTDDFDRFSSGSGPNVAPYLNFWITDGAGNFAVVANEPSNAAFQSLYNNGSYDLDFADLSDKVAKIYETTDKSWLPSNGVGLTFGDLSGFKIQAPTVAELTAGWSGLGTGAPRELTTNIAYGVNWVFGDTLSNYVAGDPGYSVVGPQVAAVPEPGTLAIACMALLIPGLRRRRLRR
ncbi:hypothetical protein [Roseiconus lacunae]|uniref:hypothetical protein n=1 Tax=Roseiconus lacunae TaxID=2605694 RepID=UPI0011F3D7D2|nr:hypothetical protein [Roseiconus lacunae]